MPASHVLAFAALSTVLIAIPGPSVLFTISRALTGGQRDYATAPAFQLELLEPFREGTPAAGSPVFMTVANDFAHAPVCCPG